MKTPKKRSLSPQTNPAEEEKDARKRKEHRKKKKKSAKNHNNEDQAQEDATATRSRSRSRSRSQTRSPPRSYAHSNSQERHPPRPRRQDSRHRNPSHEEHYRVSRTSEHEFPAPRPRKVDLERRVSPWRHDDDNRRGLGPGRSRDWNREDDSHRRRHHQSSQGRHETRAVKEEPHSDEEDQRRERRLNEDRRIERKRKDRDPQGIFPNNSNPFGTGKEEFNWGKTEAEKNTNIKEEEDGEPPKEKPNFEPSGKLVADTNTFNGVVIKYNQPPEARKPKLRWRLYPFKGEETLPVLYIHRQSAYMIGRDRRVVDVPVDHPSCSKQHAVIQYRVVKHEREDGSLGRKIKPYIIDLGISHKLRKRTTLLTWRTLFARSANGTFLNNNKIEPQRYVEIRERDVLKFGFSSREYVVLNENSHDSGGEGEEKDD